MSTRFLPTIVAVVCLMLMSSRPAAARPEHELMSYAELEQYAQQESWMELLQHLGDIRHVKRNARWRELVEMGAVGRLQLLNEDGMFSQAKALCDQLLQRYPVLHDSERFMQKWVQVLLARYEACLRVQSKHESCISDLLLEIKEIPRGSVFAHRAGKTVTRTVSAAAAAPFFEVAVQAYESTYTCNDQAVSASILAALKLSPHSSQAALTRRFVADSCWPKLKEQLLSEFDSQRKAGNYHRNICPLLLSAKALGPEQIRRCEEAAL